MSKNWCARCSAAGKPFSGVFRLGAIPTIAPVSAPARLAAVDARSFRRLQLQLREDLTARLLEGLRARTLDAAVIALPYVAQGIASTPVAEDEFLLLCPLRSSAGCAQRSRA